jgi:heme/copper-type cytochrome/quinol oxidase subunit 3
VLRFANGEWPRPFALQPASVFSTVMTVVLLASSLTMVWAVAAMKAGERSAVVKWLSATILGGVIFIALHLTEWNHLIHASSITPATLFGSVFFAVTGLHMAHVAGGVVYLSVLAAGVARGRFNEEDIETGGLYWHFVDLVWMFVFPLVYLMAVQS